MQKINYSNIDEYIQTFPEEIRRILQKIRMTINEATPDAEEAISYQIPTFKLNGNLVHFGAYKKHIGLYPAPRGNNKFKKELAAYKVGKGTVRFPLDKPIPLQLIKKIVEYRAKENLEKKLKKDKQVI